MVIEYDFQSEAQHNVTPDAKSCQLSFAKKCQSPRTQPMEANELMTACSVIHEL